MNEVQTTAALEESTEAMSNDRFNEWLRSRESANENFNGEIIVEFEDLHDAINNDESITEGTYNSFVNGDYTTDPAMLAINMDFYLFSVNKIIDLSSKILDALYHEKDGHCTQYTDDFINYAIRDINSTAERMTFLS